MTKPTPGNPAILLRLPPEIEAPLIKESKKEKVSIQRLILQILSDHYDADAVLPGRGRPAKTDG